MHVGLHTDTVLLRGCQTVYLDAISIVDLKRVELVQVASVEHLNVVQRGGRKVMPGLRTLVVAPLHVQTHVPIAVPGEVLVDGETRWRGIDGKSTGRSIVLHVQAAGGPDSCRFSMHDALWQVCRERQDLHLEVTLPGAVGVGRVSQAVVQQEAPQTWVFQAVAVDQEVAVLDSDFIAPSGIVGVIPGHVCCKVSIVNSFQLNACRGDLAVIIVGFIQLSQHRAPENLVVHRGAPSDPGRQGRGRRQNRVIRDALKVLKGMIGAAGLGSVAGAVGCTASVGAGLRRAAPVKPQDTQVESYPSQGSHSLDDPILQSK